MILALYSPSGMLGYEQDWELARTNRLAREGYQLVPFQVTHGVDAQTSH